MLQYYRLMTTRGAAQVTVGLASATPGYNTLPGIAHQLVKEEVTQVYYDSGNCGEYQLRDILVQ